MATELTMPQMGYDMQEGTVLRWLKGEGDAVANGEPIAEIETDKAVVEFESYADGVLHRIIVPAGTTVPVGQPIAVVGGQDESVEVSGGVSEDTAEDEVASAPAEGESDDAPSAAIPIARRKHTGRRRRTNRRTRAGNRAGASACRAVARIPHSPPYRR